ncbi:MAG: GNAT family N-acetyltransferase [Gemmatimonadaceae bacterium]
MTGTQRSHDSLISTVEITEEYPSALPDYARVPIAFEVREVFDVMAAAHGTEGPHLRLRTLATPYVKDYDADPAHGPLQWVVRFDLRRWGFFKASLNGNRVGAAAIVHDSPDIDMLERQSDLALLWDLRVAPDARREGVGALLFQAAERWASMRGARRLKVETQNINVPACRFYASQGCTLGATDHTAYPDLPDEVQLLWYKELATPLCLQTTHRCAQNPDPGAAGAGDSPAQ